MNVYRNRNFLLSYAASFISLFGSKLLMMSYVAYIFEAKGSATYASIVFAAEWVTSLVIGLFGARHIDRMNAKHLLIGLNVIAAFVTLLFVNFTSPDLYSYAIAIIIARALLSHSINASRLKALVQFFTKEETNTFSPIFNSSLFIATALAGAVGIYILRFISFTTVIYIDAATFLAAAGLFILVRPNKQRLEESTQASQTAATGGLIHFKNAFSVIAKNTDLASSIFYIILTVTSFQATYEILITTIPQVWFKLGKSGTALFFMFESVFVTLGAFFYQYLNRRGHITQTNQRALNLATLAFATGTYLFIPTLKNHLYLCMFVFNVMVIAVELLWTHHFKQMIAHIPPAKIVAVTGLQTALGYSLMGVFAFTFSAGIDHFGIRTAMYLNILLLALLVGGWESLTKSRMNRAAASMEATEAAN